MKKAIKIKVDKDNTIYKIAHSLKKFCDSAEIKIEWQEGVNKDKIMSINIKVGNILVFVGVYKILRAIARKIVSID